MKLVTFGNMMGDIATPTINVRTEPMTEFPKLVKEPRITKIETTQWIINFALSAIIFSQKLTT